MGAVAPGVVQAASEPADQTAAPHKSSKEKRDDLKAFLKQKIAERPRFNPPAIGQRPEKELTSPIDWDKVRALLDQSKEEDEDAAKTGQPPKLLAKLTGLRPFDPDKLPRLHKPELAPILIPVLVPADEALRDSVQVFGQIDAYSAIAEDNSPGGGGVAVRISGTRKKLVLPKKGDLRKRIAELKKHKPALPGFDDPYLISRSESSTDLSFSRFGAGYVLSVMCDDPDTDVRCTEDDYIRGLADSLVVLNHQVNKARLKGAAPKEEEPPAKQTPKQTPKQAPQPEPKAEPKPEPVEEAETVPVEKPAVQEPSKAPPAKAEKSDTLTDETGEAFAFLPVGQLLPDSGPGFVDDTVYRPDIAFPTEERAFINSQVYRYGGYHGPDNGMEGGQCDTHNYDYPWQDTFCEKHSRNQVLCPGGGHEGLDIRPATCAKDAHWAVAVEDARVTDIRRHWVTLQTADGTLYNYLHMNMSQLAVTLGDAVHKGQRLGLISNEFHNSDGSSVPTTIHLHFEMYENYVTGDTDDPLFTKVNPYTTLVAAYDRKLRGE